ncbi:uncharacterized protein K02A2.6-like [Amphibalanus amphitrite]|uniref:uncharacterized protein K02A2.6-like n=1 Tax=Amphibalanus amphitrite TaxID=1232801 RepID=UPI001C929B75|nr:uncharacterized protein K02A2.6-like [Amphibalanus amphitrite]
MGLDLLKQLDVNLHPASGAIDQLAVTGSAEVPEPPPSQPDPGEICSLTTVRGYQHRIVLRPDAVPVRHKLRRLPYAVREEVSRELDRLQEEGVIEPVEVSDWVHPMVVSRKRNGKLRICVDLRDLNRQVIAEVHPLPTAEELQDQLKGNIFTVIDLQSAYHQLELEPASRQLTTFLTHRGLRRFTRVPFGLVSAGSAFQRLLDNLLDGIPGCVHYMDDVAVVGVSQEEHDDRLRRVMARLKEANLTVNREKSVFSKAAVDFCGFTLSASGVTPLQSQIKAVTDAPPPENAKELKSFLGMCGWFLRFVPGYAETVHPLYRLLKKGTKFVWDDTANRAFNEVKLKIAASPTLKPFDQSLPTFVTSDGSGKGAGAVLTQLSSDGEENAVAFWSRAFTPTEQRYSVSELEALSAVLAVEHWKLYLWGRPFTLRTDHSALQTLLSPSFSGRAGARIARWQARLLPYAYTVQYVPGRNLTPAADALSRMPVPAEEADLHEDSSAEEVIALLTDEESVLTEQAVRTAYLELAHSAHDGIVRMKQALRNLAWWPGINREVEELCRSCERCQHSDAVLSQRARPAPMQPVDLPDRAWSKLGMDIVGPINGAPATARYAITLIDYRSKWAEVCLTSSTETEDVIKFLSTVWAKEGYPDEIVTDNGPQFTSREFTAYLAARGVKHTKSSVYWPRGNSAVERFNKTFKSWITDCPPAAFIDEEPTVWRLEFDADSSPTRGPTTAAVA